MAWDSAALAAEGAPKWHQIAGILRQAISDGEFAPGSTMPTEAQLNGTFGVSRTTARAALNKLVQEGLILRRSGVGSVVLAPRVDQPVSQLRGFSDDMRGRGLEPAYTTLEAGWRQATGEVAHALDLASSDTPFRSFRLFKANDRIMGVSESWVRPDVFGAIAPPDARDLETGSLYAWLRTRCGVEITGGVEYIEAQPSDREIASLLMIASGDPVLVVTRVAKTAGGLPIEYAVVTYRADRYRFVIDL